jgi:ABC-type molybdate transport system substrate-binding protein
MVYAAQCVLAGLSVGVLALGACRGPARTTLTISVAASLTETIGEIEAQYRQTHASVDFRNNFGGSGMLAREIEQGAPVDVFLSAAAGPMDELQAKGLIVAGTRHRVSRGGRGLRGLRMRAFGRSRWAIRGAFRLGSTARRR